MAERERQWRIELIKPSSKFTVQIRFSSSAATAKCTSNVTPRDKEREREKKKKKKKEERTVQLSRGKKKKKKKKSWKGCGVRNFGCRYDQCFCLVIVQFRLIVDHPRLNVLNTLLRGLDEFIKLMRCGRILQLRVASKRMLKDGMVVDNIREGCYIWSGN